MEILPWVWEGHILRWGPAWLVLHDNGWTFCWRQAVKLEGTWPTYKTIGGL